MASVQDPNGQILLAVDRCLQQRRVRGLWGLCLYIMGQEFQQETSGLHQDVWGLTCSGQVDAEHKGHVLFPPLCQQQGRDG